MEKILMNKTFVCNGWEEPLIGSLGVLVFANC